MPKSTFFNLPNEKKEKITNAAIEEFGKYSFDAASVNRIVENSNIAKGSFYQYFNGLKDLYEYIINIIMQKKLEYLGPLLSEEISNLNFFEIIRKLYRSGLEFAHENPSYARIGNKLLSQDGRKIYKELLDKNANKAKQIFTSLIEKAIEKNELRDNIDVRFTAYIITVINTAIADYYLLQGAEKFDDDLLDVAKEAIDLLERGIKKEENK